MKTSGNVFITSGLTTTTVIYWQVETTRFKFRLTRTYGIMFALQKFYTIDEKCESRTVIVYNSNVIQIHIDLQYTCR